MNRCLMLLLGCAVLFIPRYAEANFNKVLWEFDFSDPVGTQLGEHNACTVFEVFPCSVDSSITPMLTMVDTPSEFVADWGPRVAEISKDGPAVFLRFSNSAHIFFHKTYFFTWEGTDNVHVQFAYQDISAFPDGEWLGGDIFPEGLNPDFGACDLGLPFCAATAVPDAFDVMLTSGDSGLIHSVKLIEVEVDEPPSLSLMVTGLIAFLGFVGYRRRGTM